MRGDEDEALVARAREGDREAFRMLVDRHYARIRRFAWRRCGDAAEADDVAQETLIRIAKNLARFEGRSSFSTWCLGIALNAARDSSRARARRETTLKEAAVMALAEPSGTVEDDGSDDLWRAVAALPQRQRDAILLVHVEGFSHREAAAALGCAEPTVSWHVFAARKKLRAMLSRRAP